MLVHIGQENLCQADQWAVIGPCWRARVEAGLSCGVLSYDLHNVGGASRASCIRSFSADGDRRSVD